MTKILFVCYGNICRSPAAEFVMKDLVCKAGREKEFQIASAAVSSEEIWNGIGSPVYSQMKAELLANGIGTPENELGVSRKQARQMTREDYFAYDYLVGMDRGNLRDMRRICGGDPDGKMSLLLDHTTSPGEVADPWYTRDFRQALKQIRSGCEGLLQELS